MPKLSGFVLVSGIVGGCNLFIQTSGLSGESVPHDDDGGKLLPSHDGGLDAVGANEDGSTDASRRCKTALFCDTFDEGDAFAKWETSTSAAGPLSLVTTPNASLPNAFRTTVVNPNQQSGLFVDVPIVRLPCSVSFYLEAEIGGATFAEILPVMIYPLPIPAGNIVADLEYNKKTTGGRWIYWRRRSDGGPAEADFAPDNGLTGFHRWKVRFSGPPFEAQVFVDDAELGRMPLESTALTGLRIAIGAPFVGVTVSGAPHYTFDDVIVELE